MRLIAEEFERIEREASEIDNVSFFSSQHKRTREWHVLGGAQHLLIQAGADHPTFAEESEPPSPDFITYDKENREWSPIEIVEVLDPRIPRHKTYKEMAKTGQTRQWIPLPLDNYWSPLREQILKKSRKPYAADTTLIVYFDIWSFAFKDRSISFHTGLIFENNSAPIEGLQAFRKALVLNSRMDSLVQLHPSVLVIVPDPKTK